MTDYLEEGPGPRGGAAPSAGGDGPVDPGPGRPDGGGGWGHLPPCHGSLYTGQFRFPGGSAGAGPGRTPPGSSTGAEALLIRGGREDGEEALPLLSVLLERERAAAALNEIRTAQEASGMRRSGGGLEAGPIPLHRPFSQVGGLGMGPDSRRPEPDWAREAESSSGPSIRQMDQAFRRDSRRYDGGFFLY